jgi:hypothetical protein
MSPFEALYDRKCNTPMSWDNPIERTSIGSDLLKEMEEMMKRIKNSLKVVEIGRKFMQKRT